MRDRPVMIVRCAIIALLIFASGVPLAEARGPDDRGEPRWPGDAGRSQRTESQGTLSLGEVVARVRGELGGRLIDARLEGSTYSLLWELPDRRIVRVRVDASSGAIRGVEGRGR